MQGDRAAAARLRRDQIEPTHIGQPALVQGWAMSGDPGVDEDGKVSRFEYQIRHPRLKTQR